MKPVIHDPGNETVIDTVFAFMSIDERCRNGIIASILPGLGSTPLVTSKREVAENMRPLAKHIAKATGKRVGLFEFRRVGTGPIWDFKP